MFKVASFCAVLLISASLVSAQTNDKHGQGAATPSPAPEFSHRLPTEETVNAFLQQMFGYDATLSWKVADIRPSDAEGLAKVTVVISNSQGQQITVL